MNKNIFNFLWIIPITFLLTSCEKQEASRTYTEVAVEAPQAEPAMGSDKADPHAGMNIDPAMMKNMGGADPHSGFTKEQLAQMLQQQSPNAMAAQSAISWTLPATWQEKPATGMRVATFVSKSDPKEIDCSIVSLGGGAGGLAPNVIRWLGQLNMAAPPEAELENFIEKQEKLNLADGLTALLVDFTGLQSKSPDATPSMLAAIIDTPTQRIFVKMTGTKQKVAAEAKNYKALVQSIKIKK